eukprot:263818_1
MTNLNAVISTAYIAIQASIIIVVSIIGAIHVRRCILESNSNADSHKYDISSNFENVQSTSSINLTNDATLVEEKQVDIEDPKLATDIEDSQLPTDIDSKNVKNICKLWCQTVWKMRGIYSGFAVHSFDVLTDILVINEWMNEPNEEGDNIDPQVMAYSAIFVLLSSRIISAIAIYIKDGNIWRGLLQLFDLLIFVEIFNSHRKIASQVKQKQLSDKNTAIESTLSFKYVRNFEAVFESIPESVLQLVYVMRTGDIKEIFIISIIQSVVSMTNSILNNDYTQ